MHPQDAADPFFPVGNRVVRVRARCQRAAVDTEVCQTSDVRVCHNLERQRGEFLIIGDPPCYRVLQIHMVTDDFPLVQIERRRKERDNRIEEALHTLVLEGRTAQHRNDVYLQTRSAQDSKDLIRRDLFPVEVFRQQGVILIRDRLEHLGPVLLGLRLHALGDGNVFPFGPQRRFLVHPGFHGDKVDHSCKQIPFTHRKLHRYRVRAQAVLDHLDHCQEIRADAVHLVDKSNPGDAVFIHLTPHRFRLRFDAADGAKKGYRAIEHTEGSLHLGGEVHMPRGVNNIDLVVVPKTGRCRRRDRDAAFLLLLHPVHGGGAVVHLAHPMENSRIKEDALSRCCLSGIDVGANPNVPGPF